MRTHLLLLETTNEACREHDDEQSSTTCITYVSYSCCQIVAKFLTLLLLISLQASQTTLSLDRIEEYGTTHHANFHMR